MHPAAQDYDRTSLMVGHFRDNAGVLWLVGACPKCWRPKDRTQLIVFRISTRTGDCVWSKNLPKKCACKQAAGIHQYIRKLRAYQEGNLDVALHNARIRDQRSIGNYNPQQT